MTTIPDPDVNTGTWWRAQRKKHRGRPMGMALYFRLPDLVPDAVAVQAADIGLQMRGGLNFHVERVFTRGLKLRYSHAGKLPGAPDLAHIEVKFYIERLTL